MSRSSFTSLLVLTAVLVADAALGQGTTFILDVLGAARPGPKEGGVVPWTFRIDAPAEGLVEVNVDIILDVALEPCASQPELCRGENLITAVDPDSGITFITGCSDMMDNDLDGMTDAEDIECIGVGGFSFSLATEDSFNINRATTRGTVSDLNIRPPGIRDPDGAFEKSEIVDPARNSGQEGAVCVVVFSFDKYIKLRSVSRQVVMKMRGSIDVSPLRAPGDRTAPCLLRILDPSEVGLVGSGQPVVTAISVGGETNFPVLCNATVEFLGEDPSAERSFIRCDPNNDGGNNLADAIWIVNELFRQGPASTCPDAADCNDDGMTDLSDAIFTIEYQFRGGRAPPSPFPDCGIDPTSGDTLARCARTSSCA